MTPERVRRAEELSNQVRSLPAGERMAAVKAACAGDAEIQDKVLELLKHADPADATQSAPGETVLCAPLGPSGDHAPGADSFAGYRILKEIHRGGQGIVYQAVQQSTRRKVAIKVVKEGPLASHAAKARFEREVEILGQLKHPNIVTIHDSGEAAGHFYYVMDYISGQPLDSWMTGGQRSIGEVLCLFQTICEAVNAAHLRGVIHRDLKPGNIRVDDTGQPHILDFGLAKVSSATADASLMTLTGQFLGSLPWASPEQAEGAPDKIDIRTDVYSLGVILYQMLTGKFPYEVIGNMRDVLDRIMKAEAARPSTIRRQVNDELDTIVLKCLQKERVRRYQSAGELARDVHRYLAGEPIEAKRDSALYVLRKTLRRYQAHAAVAAAFAMLLMAGAALSTSLYVRADKALHRESLERARAQAARVAETSARQHAEVARDAAQRERLHAEELLGAAQADEGLRLLESGSNAGLLYLAQACRTTASLPGVARRWAFLWAGWQAGRAARVAGVIAAEAPVFAMAISSDGRLLVTAAADRIQGWDLTTLQPQYAPLPVPGATHVGLRADGKLFVCGPGERRRVFELSTSQVLADYRGDPRLTDAEADEWLETEWTSEGVLAVKDPVTGVKLCALRTATGTLDSVTLSRDHRWAAVAEGGETVELFDAASGQRQGEPLKGGAKFKKMSFSPDGRLLAIRWQDGDVGLWETATGARHCGPLSAGRGGTIPEQVYAQSMLFSPDSALLATDLRDEIQLWETASGKPRGAPLRHPANVRTMAFSGDSRLLATGTDDGQVRIWSTATAQAVQLPLWHPGPVSTVRFSGDGEGVATLAADGTVRLWNLAAGQAERPPWLRQGGCSGVACAPDESAIATAAGDTISIWDAVTLRPRGAAIHCPGDVGPLAFAPRGDLLAGGLFTTASGKGTVGVWNLATGSSEMRAFGTEPGASAFSPDGRLLAVLALDGTVRLWEAATGQPHGKPLRGPREEVTWVDVRFSSDGRYVIARNGFETLRIWECATGKLPYADRPISGCSVDGQRILAISKEGAAVLQADTGRPCGNPVPLGAMFTLPPVLDPGGQTVAAVAGQGITLWDVATGRLRVPSLPLSGHCRRLAFSPDASLLAAIVGREILVWDVTTGKRYGRPLPVTGEWIPDIVFSPRGGILISPAFQRFSAPPPDPEDIERQTWAVLGARVNAQGTVEAIPAVEWLTLRRNLAETRPTPSASK